MPLLSLRACFPMRLTAIRCHTTTQQAHPRAGRAEQCTCLRRKPRRMRAEAFSSLLLPPECPWEAGTTCGEREEDTPKRASSKAKLDRGEAGRGQEQQRGERAKGRPDEVSTFGKGLCRHSTPEANW